MEEIIQYNEANLIDYIKKLHEEPPTNEVNRTQLQIILSTYQFLSWK